MNKSSTDLLKKIAEYLPSVNTLNECNKTLSQIGHNRIITDIKNRIKHKKRWTNGYEKKSINIIIKFIFKQKILTADVYASEIYYFGHEETISDVTFLEENLSITHVMDRKSDESVLIGPKKARNMYDSLMDYVEKVDYNLWERLVYNTWQRKQLSSSDDEEVLSESDEEELVSSESEEEELVSSEGEEEYVASESEENKEKI